jgi:uncharacterized protein
LPLPHAFCSKLKTVNPAMPTPLLLPVTTTTTALLALLFCGLALRVLFLRVRLGVTLGDVGHPALQRAVRAHGNFAEFVPLALLLLLLLELAGAPALVCHGYGGLLVLARVLHAFGVSQVDEELRWRISGKVLTICLMSVGAAWLLWRVAV